MNLKKVGIQKLSLDLLYNLKKIITHVRQKVAERKKTSSCPISLDSLSTCVTTLCHYPILKVRHYSITMLSKFS